MLFLILGVIKEVFYILYSICYSHIQIIMLLLFLRIFQYQ